MPTDYTVLASLYDILGMHRFASEETKVIFDFAQRNGWMGRQILDLGCGTGESMLWLSKKGYVVAGVDQSGAMLDIARQRFVNEGLNLTLYQQDIRQLSEIDNMHMVLALDVLNELDSVKDLEMVFQHVAGILKSGKFFVFDLYTIQGLFELHQQGSTVAYEDKNQLIFTETDFDYDRQVLTQRILAFRANGNAWSRSDARRTLRSYPLQALIALLQRSQFDVPFTLTTQLDKYEVGKSQAPRVVIMAVKR